MIEQNEMVSTLIDVAERLDGLGIKYMVTGSFAMASYVTARTTMDIDIVLEIKASDASRFEQKFIGDYYVDVLSIVRAYEHQSMFNIINNTTLVKVDCILKKQDAFEIEKFERRQSSEIGGLKFWVIGKEDLILSKLRWAQNTHSERQFEDIRNLLESGADDSFLSAHIDRIGLKDVWMAFEEWKIRVEK